MPKLTDEVAFGGAVEKIVRLGLTPLYDELKQILQGFQLLVREEKDANGGAAVRKMIDAEFESRRRTGWTKQQTGAVDWTKCRIINGTSLCIGVEIQVSGRSDLLIVDIIHLRRALTGGRRPEMRPRPLRWNANGPDITPRRRALGRISFRSPTRLPASSGRKAGL